MAENLWQTIEPWMVDVRRQIHRFPELGLETPHTQQVVEEALDFLQISHHRLIGTGVVGVIAPNAQGPAMLLRADMDALPILEATGLPFSSEISGRMHACGHDMHTAMLLGAAYYLKHHEAQLSHPVILMFQPGEEGPGGALPMIEAGILDNPPVSRAVMVHVDSDLAAGVVGLFSGPAMASPNDFSITVKGRGGHGAHPDKTVDAIIAATAIVQACQTLVSREEDPTEPLVVTFGTICGGYRENVIADTVEMTGTIRILSPNNLDGTL
ncbi:MAG: M20 family metallopeptidase, partial [Sulfobacillus thermotolerans]|nr:M20 family metallopeptidase [Sulfobacillus thermotolerans]